MPRYDDRYGNTRLYVGRLSSRTRSRDLEYLFSRYGRVRDVELKHDYAFVEFSDPRDADDARYSLDGRDLDGARLVVEFARGGPRGGGGGSRDYGGRGPPPGTGRCFNCGIDGHWARDCKAGDWKNKCYRCGERGHIERNCQNSPKNLRRERDRSYSRSPSPRRGRSRSYSRSRSYRRGRSYSRSSSYSRSRSPRRERRDDRRERSRSRYDSRSPRGGRSPVSKSHKRSSLSPADNRSRSRSPMAKGGDNDRNGGSSPMRDASRSPSPADNRRKDAASPATNGRSPSPRDVDNDNNNHTGKDNRGSESPES